MSSGAFWISFARRALHSLALTGVMLLSGCASGAEAAAVEQLGGAIASPASSKSNGNTYTYRLVPATPQEESPKPTASQKLRLLGPFTRNARVVDREGSVVRRAPEGGSIGTLAMSPDQQWALLYFGDAEYSVVSTDSLEDIASPPKRPGGYDDATGIRWFVLDDDLLLGQASLPSLETEGLTASEREGLPPRETLVFIYSISARSMAPVEIDGRFQTPFSIVGAADGHAVLLTFVEDERLGARIVRSAEH